MAWPAWGKARKSAGTGAAIIGLEFGTGQRGYGGPFDPIGFDEERARFCMENMVRWRRGPLASHRSGSRRRKR